MPPGKPDEDVERVAIDPDFKQPQQHGQRRAPVGHLRPAALTLPSSSMKRDPAEGSPRLRGPIANLAQHRAAARLASDAPGAG